MCAIGAEAAASALSHTDSRAKVSANFVYLCAVFVLLGVVTTMLGPLLPLLSQRWHLSPAIAGSLFSWQFCGATAGTMLSSRWSGLKFKLVLRVGLAGCLAGTLGLAFFSGPWQAVAVGLYGAGLGFAIPAINLHVSASSDSPVSSLAILNSCWTVGAITGPLAMQLFSDVKWFLSSLAAMLMAALFASLYIRGAKAATPARRTVAGGPARTIALFGALFFLYVGTENAIAGWVTWYAMPVWHDLHLSMNASAIFWVAFLCSRLVTVTLPERWNAQQAIWCGSILAAIGIVVLYIAKGSAALVAGISVAGFGLGGIYPVMIAKMAKKLGADSPAATVCFAFSGLGAAVIPFLAGWLGQASAKANNGLIFSLLATVLILILYPFAETAVRGLPESRATV